MQKNILISGITSSLNRGVDALVRMNVTLINQEFPNSKIYILTLDAQDKQEWSDLSGEIIHIPKLPIFFRAFRKFGFNLNVAIENWYKDFFLKNLPEKIDIHVITGGDIFSSEYGGFGLWADIAKHVYQIYKPVTYLSAHSIGRFNSSRHVDDFAKLLELTDCLSTRENATMEYLQETYKDFFKETTQVPCLFTPDPAFILQPSITNWTEQHVSIIDELRAKSPKGIISYSVSSGIAKFKGMTDEVIYRERISFIRELIRLGFGVVLIAHVQGNSSDTSDAKACKRIKEELKELKENILIVSKGNASELKQIIRLTDFLIAERMHAAIAGLSSKVPTIVIAYSLKAEGILRDLFHNEEDFNKVYYLIEPKVFSRLINEQFGSEKFEIPTVSETRLQEYQALVSAGYKALKKVVKSKQ